MKNKNPAANVELQSESNLASTSREAEKVHWG